MTIMGPTTVRACPHCGQWIREVSYLTGNDFGARYWTDGYMQGLMLPDVRDLVKCPTCSKTFWISEAKEKGEYMSSVVYSLEPRPQDIEKYDCAPWTPADRKEVAQHKKLYSWSLNTDRPNERDYLEFIKNNTLTTDEERLLRTLSWWEANESYRRSVNSESIGWYIHGDKSSEWIFKEPIEIDIPNEEDFLDFANFASMTGEVRESWLELMTDPAYQLSVDDILDLRERYEGIFKVKFSPAQIINIKALRNMLDDTDPNDLIMKAEIARELGDFDEAYKLLNSLFPEEYQQRITRELYESYLSMKEERERYGDVIKEETAEELYESHINEFKSTIDAIKFLCDHKIVGVADIGVVLCEISK